jgi:hypothetical protein
LTKIFSFVKSNQGRIAQKHFGFGAGKLAPSEAD